MNLNITLPNILRDVDCPDIGVIWVYNNFVILFFKTKKKKFSCHIARKSRETSGVILIVKIDKSGGFCGQCDMRIGFLLFKKTQRFSLTFQNILT